MVEGLFDRDNSAAHACLRALSERSGHTAEVYAYFDTFAAMLDGDNAYIRIRGLTLMAANAKWDADNKLDAAIGAFCALIADDKPIVARKCIGALPEIARQKPVLRAFIETALMQADGRYRDSMRPLVHKDIAAALREIRSLE